MMSDEMMSRWRIEFDADLPLEMVGLPHSG
jgi:hypothetical protein